MSFQADYPNTEDKFEGVRGWLLAAAVSLGTALLIASPFFVLGNVSGHDFGFHVSSWLDAAGQWKEGIFYPRWMKLAYSGFGEPRFIFYPPLSWMLGAALGFVLPWCAVPVAFIVLVQTLAGLSSYALARRFLSPRGALLASACYAANPYALLDIYLRTAFAELLACALLPAAIGAALELCGLVRNGQRSVPRSLAFFAVAFAAVWLSDAPVGVIASYSAALIFAWAAFEEKSLRQLWRGILGMALGFGLTGFYLLPAAYEQRWINAANLVSTHLRLSPSENFLYTQTFVMGHLTFNWTTSSVAILIMTITGIAAIGLHRESVWHKAQQCDTETVWRIMVLLSASAIFLMTSSSLILWKYLPKLRFVQFPWRWTAILAVCYAFFVAGAIAVRRARWICTALALAVIGATGAIALHIGKSENRWGRKPIRQRLAWMARDLGLDSAGEYSPLGEQYTPLPLETETRVSEAYSSTTSPGLALILPAEPPLRGRTPAMKLQVKRWGAEERDVEVNAEEPALLCLRLMNYPAWHVEVNDQTVTPQRFKDWNAMVVSVPTGKSLVHVRFARTSDRVIGNGLSTVSIFVLGLVFWADRSARSTATCARGASLATRGLVFAPELEPQSSSSLRLNAGATTNGSQKAETISK